MVKKTIEKIKAIDGRQSLIGVNTSKYPVSHGNYFDFASGERSLNMWVENFSEIISKKEILEVECTVFSDGKNRLAFITDGRIPANWLHEKLCVTGRGWGSRELCEACCEFQGASTENRICGCEQADQAPQLSQFGDLMAGTEINICHNCGREFLITSAI